jgi:recombination protein RecR
MELPESIKRLASELAALPSIGPRQAARMAFHLAHRDRSETDALARSVGELSRLKTCARCFFLHENGGALCAICASGARNGRLVMVVEKETDLLSLENTGLFKGRYLVLGEMPRAGVLAAEQKRRLKVLVDDLAALPGGKAEEIILAFNPTTLGDFHANLIIKELAPRAKKVSRLGRGLPSGGEIEFADDETLGSAFEARR